MYAAGWSPRIPISASKPTSTRARCSSCAAPPSSARYGASAATNFRIEPGEGLKITQFALLGLLLQAGLAFGMAGADSLFLIHAGPEKLPHIYLLTPAMMLLYIPAYSALLARWGLDRVMDCTLGLLVLGGTLLWIACTRTAGAEPLVLCYAAKLYTALWYVGLYSLFWNFIDGYFDLIDAKRLFALFAAGSATGAIIGGSMVSVITGNFGVRGLFLAWAVCAVLAWPVAVWTRRRWRKLETDEAGEGSEAAFAQVAIATRALVRSRYATVLMFVLFTTLISATICEYQYLGIFAAGLDEVALASLLGRMTAMVSVFNLGLNLFFFNRIVARLGVRNVALTQPIAYAIVFTWLLLNGGFPAAVAGFVAYQGIMTVVYFNNVNLMYAGLPVNGRKQIRTVIEGLGEPIATATAGFYLLFEAPRLSPEQLSLAGVVVSLVCLGLVFMLRADYVKAIATNLRRDWLDFSRPAEPLLDNASATDLTLAESRVRISDPVGAAFSLRVLWRNDQTRAVRALLPFLQKAPPEALRHVQPLLEEILPQRGSAAAQEIQRWLDEEGVTPDVELAGELGRHGLLPARQAERLRHSGGSAARGAAAVTLWQSWRVRDNRRALDEIEALLSATDDASTIAGLRALGQLGEPRYAYLLRDHINAPSAGVRRAALTALRAIAGPASRVLMPELLLALANGTSEERELALDAFERIGDSGALGAMLEAVETFTQSERRRAEQLILRLGPRCVPTLIATAQNATYTVTARSIVLRALGKLAQPQMQVLATPLVDSTARKAYQFLGGYAALAAEPHTEAGRAVLCRVYRDYPALALEIVLETLTVAGRLPGFGAITAALQSTQSKDRGYAIESIEQACSRDTFALLLPLLDGRSLEAQVAFGREHGLVPAITSAQVIDDSLNSSFPLRAAAAASALYGTDPAGSAERLLARLREPTHPLIRETVVTLLARRTGTRPRSETITIVEMAQRLMQAPELSGCLFLHHEILAPYLQPIMPADGTVLCRRGEALPGAWFVLAGQVESDHGAVITAGGTAGALALQGVQISPETLTARAGTSALFLPAAGLRHGVEVFPELGLAMLKHKLVA